MIAVSARLGSTRWQRGTGTCDWDADTDAMAADAVKQADVYVFALLAHEDKTTVKPLAACGRGADTGSQSDFVCHIQGRNCSVSAF